MRAGLGLPGFPFDDLAQMAIRKQFGLFMQALRLFGETFFEGFGLCETASLHGAAPFLEEAGARDGVLITDKSRWSRGDDASVGASEAFPLFHFAHLRQVDDLVGTAKSGPCEIQLRHKPTSSLDRPTPKPFT
jgi:hypothetical protein